jgi:hypothetical protein
MLLDKVEKNSNTAFKLFLSMGIFCGMSVWASLSEDDIDKWRFGFG